MPIEGDLKSLNLSSVLQLIGQERLTGVLKIKKRNELADVGFADGEVTGAFYEKGDNVDRLEAYLVRSGMLGKNVYELVNEIHNETKRPIMNIILEDRYLAREEVERVIRFKIQEVFDELFRWNEGAFKFEQGSIIYPKSLIKIRMKTEGLILEAARRIDEWPRIQETLQSGDIVLKKVERPELKFTSSENEKRLLALLDGHRSIDDLIEIDGLGKFNTYSTLYKLFSTGQIEIAYAKPSVKRTRPKKKPVSLRFMTVPVGIVITVALVLFEFLLGGFIARNRIISIDLINREVYETNDEVYRHVYFYKHNRLPSMGEVQDIFKE
jgi:hypothetical protein